MDDRIVVPLPSRSPQIVGQAIVYRTMSLSRAGRWHYTLIQISEGTATEPLPEVIVLCSCDGYQNHGHCWHTGHALDQLAIDTNPEADQ